MRFPDLKFTRHFDEDRSHLSDRWVITIEMCQRVIESPIKEESQEDGSINFWGYIEESDRYLKVAVNPESQRAITAHFDRGFRQTMRRGDG